MSSALVRTALEFVDPEDSHGKSKKAKRPAPGQEQHPYRNKRKSKQPEKKQKSVEELAEENIRKLLALSRHTADPNLTKKIVNRTVGRKPIVDKIEVKKEDGKSILFAEEDRE